MVSSSRAWCVDEGSKSWTGVMIGFESVRVELEVEDPTSVLSPLSHPRWMPWKANTVMSLRH